MRMLIALAAVLLAVAAIALGAYALRRRSAVAGVLSLTWTSCSLALSTIVLLWR